jgi:hypothetical protein
MRRIHLSLLIVIAKPFLKIAGRRPAPAAPFSPAILRESPAGQNIFASMQ